MKIGPDTSAFVSVSATPGRFGSTVYNTLFERLGIDAIYLPRPAPAEARSIVDAVRSLGLAGCSVSSPHKSGVIPFLDELEPEAARANAVNTIYRGPDDRLLGACTDIDGVAGALAGIQPTNAIVFGSGGVAGPAILGLRRLGFTDITVVARNVSARAELADRFGVAHTDDARADVIVNATPAGRETLDAPQLTSLVEPAKAFLDMPVTPSDTAIIAHARQSGVDCRTGLDMCVHQIASQAHRYLGRPIDVETISMIVRREYLGLR